MGNSSDGDNGVSLTPADAAFAAAYQHITGRYPQPGDWFAEFSRKVWDAAISDERERCAKIVEPFRVGRTHSEGIVSSTSDEIDGIVGNWQRSPALRVEHLVEQLAQYVGARQTHERRRCLAIVTAVAREIDAEVAARLAAVGPGEEADNAVAVGAFRACREVYQRIAGLAIDPATGKLVGARQHAEMIAGLVNAGLEAIVADGVAGLPATPDVEGRNVS